MLGRTHRFSRLGAQLGIAVVADHLLVVLGDAQQRADHLHRHLRAEVGDEIEPFGTHQRVEALRAELPDLGLQRVDLARREHPGKELAVHVVDRRILENYCARRDLDIGFDQWIGTVDARIDQDKPLPGVDQIAAEIVSADIIEITGNAKWFIRF